MDHRHSHAEASRAGFPNECDVEDVGRALPGFLRRRLAEPFEHRPSLNDHILPRAEPAPETRTLAEHDGPGIAAEERR